MRLFHKLATATAVLGLMSASSTAFAAFASGAKSLPPPVANQSVGEGPTAVATIKVFAPSPTALVWDGKYTGYKPIDLCLTSPSGGFTLMVDTIGNGVKGAPPVPLKLRLRDGIGGIQEKIASSGTPTIFDGSAPASSACLAPNARLEVSIDMSDALRAVAGGYTYNFRFAIRNR